MADPQTKLGQRQVDPQQGYGFKEEPRPEYLRTLDDVIVRLNDPRNAWIGVGMPWLYHGTTAARAKQILEKGFDPKRVGQNWSAAFEGIGGRSGRGVYTSPTPTQALGWGLASGAEKPDVLRVFVPAKKIFDTAPIEGINQIKHYGRQAIADAAKSGGFQAVKFPNETLIMDPSSIPLRNIRRLTPEEYAEYLKPFGYGE